jgi:hypothetical protein
VYHPVDNVHDIDRTVSGIMINLFNGAFDQLINLQIVLKNSGIVEDELDPIGNVRDIDRTVSGIMVNLFNGTFDKLTNCTYKQCDR